jgi:urease accessory protein
MRLFVLIVGVTSNSVAWSHGVHATESVFISGLLHPLSGIDHLLAAAGMGLWLGLQNLTRRSIPLYSAALAAGVLIAGIWSMAGGGAGAIEWTLACSLVVTGLLLYKRLRQPQPWVAGVISAVLSCHFGAHIVEAPAAFEAGGAVFYSGGFLISTASLIAVTMILVRVMDAGAARASADWSRFAGAAIALTGVTALGLA